MVVMDIFTPSPTPPLPVRRHPPLGLLPPLLGSDSTAELVPAPLFSKRKRFPPRVLPVTVLDISQLPSPSESEPPSSPTAFSRPDNSSITSSPSASAPNSRSKRPRALAYSHQPLDLAHWEPEWRPLAMPKQSLRRKPSPKKESLRSLRVKDSEACLQKAYDQRLEAYLNGEVFQQAKWRDNMGCIEESIR